MSINGVFFDLYGTLLIYNDMYDAWSDFISQFYVCLQNNGLSIAKETFTRHCDCFFDKEEPPLREDGLTIFERRIQALCFELEFSIEVADIKHTANTILNTIQQRHYLDPDCYPVLEALRQHKTLALISNFDHPPHVYTIMGQFGLEKFFNTVVVSGDVGIKKPNPGIFYLALERTGLQPEEVVHVGDTSEDIHGALTAGITPVLLQRGRLTTVLQSSNLITDQQAMQTQPDTEKTTSVRTITSLRELIEILD